MNWISGVCIAAQVYIQCNANENVSFLYRCCLLALVKSGPQYQSDISSNFQNCYNILYRHHMILKKNHAFFCYSWPVPACCHLSNDSVGIQHKGFSNYTFYCYYEHLSKSTEHCYIIQHWFNNKNPNEKSRYEIFLNAPLWLNECLFVAQWHSNVWNSLQ